MLTAAPERRALWGGSLCVRIPFVIVPPGGREDLFSDAAAGVAGGDVYLSFLVTQAVISHSILKAWRNHPQPSVTDRNPIKHHLQMIVSLQQDNRVRDVQRVICQRRPRDY